MKSTSQPALVEKTAPLGRKRLPVSASRWGGALCLLTAVLSVVSCASLPPLAPLEPALAPAALETCRKPFPDRKVRLVHAMTAVMPGERESAAIGVFSADPATGRFRSVLMTVEGFVLFDIEAGETLQVHRAVPPFDAPAFAPRMAEDIGLAFFSPGDRPEVLGREAGGGLVCRYERSGGETVDVAEIEKTGFEIRLYGAGQDLRKRVRIPHLERPGLPEELEIWGVGWPAYGLKFRLIEAEAIEKE
ncbi:MAG TPA: hypothetical protein VIJ89_02480 [Deferrimonas sp.]